MHNFKSIYFVILFLVIYKNNAQISDKRLCVDLKCSEPASLAKTLLRYSSPDSRILSFAPNQEVKVFSKEAGSMTNLWGVEINGKKGYVPKHLLREYKIIKKPTLLVDTESKSQVPTNHENKVLEPNKVKNEFEVVDGTTIYLNPQDSINPSSSESVVQPTALPSNAEETGNKSKEIGDSKPDLNLLHNLPPGIAVSLYNAEITKNESDIKSDAKEEHSPSEQDADIKNSLPSSFPAENSINMAVSPDTQATINPDSPSLTADESKVENLPGDPSNSLTVGETNSVAENNVLDAISPDIQATNNKAIPVTQKDESIVVENRENLSLPVGETSQSTVSNIVSSENSRNFSASLTKDSVAQQPDESIKDIKDKTPALENNAAESITTEATIELGEQLPIVEGVTPNPMKTSPKEEPKTELKNRTK
ncbi:hypothetical protein NQ317_002622 [Molorchus minor]|uniref:SH3 domain-containing protein n=1 Tax=Molorchus minor TaxID=1323400 RepID=A0ABQ9IYG7_9CUCU|nr:hypothetical protein NQ317_002622 [Molorchus minor]